MAAPVTISNVLDIQTKAAEPDRNYLRTNRLWLGEGANARHAWLYFTNPWPDGATIVSAKLQVYHGQYTLASEMSLYARLADEAWAANRIKFNNQPGIISGLVASATKSSVVQGEMWEIDITNLIQEVANGQPWYGLRIDSPVGDLVNLYASDAPRSDTRPQVIIEWSDKPEQPEDLVPADLRAVSKEFPILTYDFIDLSGSIRQEAQQVQFGTSETTLEAGTTTYDTGELPTSSATLDTAQTGWGGLPDGGATWWRVRAQDSAGLWSDWSEAVAFQRRTKGTLVIDSPTGNALYDITPVISWTFTDRTQRSYQVAVAKSDDPANWIWDTGKVTSSNTTVTLPFGVFDDLNDEYLIMVRIWDTINRVLTPGDPTYVEESVLVTIQYDDVIDCHTTALSASSSPLFPKAELSWEVTGTVAPTSFVIQRSEDGGDVWEAVADEMAQSLYISGDRYEFEDLTAPPYTALLYRVVPVADGRMTSGNPTSATQVRRLAPFLYRPGGEDAVCFLNPQRSRRFMDVQEVMETLSGDGVLVTQVLGRRQGSVSGRLTGEAIPDVTAGMMLNRFLNMRTGSGETVFVAIANETIKCVAYNFQYEPVTDTGGITYEASFDWTEIR